MQQRKSDTYIDFAVVGALVDKTGQYFHVFYACAVVVASAAIFIIVSFRLLDRKSSQRAQGLGESPGRTEAAVAPSCLYKSVPTDRDKETSPPAVEYSTSI